MIALVAAAALALDPGDPNPTSTVNLDGTLVTVAQMRVLFDAFQSSKTSDAIEISFASKPPEKMPAFDPQWHYVGSTVSANNVIHSTIWISEKVGSTHEGVVYMAAGILMALMDSGFAGTYWKSFYDAETAKDKTDAAHTGSPIYHRESVALKIAQAMYSDQQ